MLHHVGGDVQLLKHLAVALKNLDGEPALLLFGHGVQGGFLDVRDGVLDGAGEGVHRNGLGAALRGFHGRFRRFHNAVALQSGDLDDLAAQLAGKLRAVDLVAVLAHTVHHVHGDDHRDAQLGQLRGEVQVALEVRAVDDVQDGVRTLGDQVITGNNFFQRVRRQAVNTGKVHDDDVVMLLELAFLFLDRDARPVAYELVGAGQRVEQRRFAAVRVACQRNFDGHD